jgi:replicative DNA helicase
MIEHLTQIEYMAQIERDLIGHCIVENSAYLEAQQSLTSADFWLGSHRVIWLAIGTLLASGRPVTLTTLVQLLQERNELEGVNGAAYVVSLTEGLVHSRGVVQDYARSIAEKARIRQFAQLTFRASEDAQSPGARLEELFAKTDEALLELRAATQHADKTSITSALPALLDRMERERTRTSDLLGLPTGLESMDTLTRGFQPGEITVAGARSGVGKSCLMCQAAAANCRQGTPVLLFSLEMSEQQVLRRLLAEDSAVPFPRVVDPGWATDADMQAIEEAARRIKTWPLTIVDNSSLTIEKLTAVARLAVRRDGVKLVAVDYAQLVSAQARDERLRVAAVSRGLTRLAKDENAPVLALSQLARADRSGPNRRPVMSDLRESSQLENDAHVIALLHREWDEEQGRLSSDGELIIAKNRSGETGALPITFNRRSLTFESREREAAHVVRREA